MKVSGDWFGKPNNGIRYLYGFRKKKVNFIQAINILNRTLKKFRNTHSISNTFIYLKTLRSLAAIYKNTKYVYFNGNIFFDCFAPKWPGESLYKILDHLTLNIMSARKQWTPFFPYVIMSITKRCIFRCEHCYAIHSLGDKDVMSLEKLLQISKEFLDIGVGVIAWEGGEPLLRYEELLTLLRETSNRSDAWLATTGYSLTPKKARALKAAGLSAAIMSLDHYDPDKHNEFRGNKNAFDIAVNAVHTFRENGILPCVAICPTGDIIENGGLYRYLELAKEIGVGFIQILDPMPAGKYLGKDDILLSKAHINEIKNFHINVNTNPKYRNYPGISARAYLEDENQFGCGACNGVCYVDSSGNMQPCVYLHIKFGNVMEERVQDVYMRMKRYFPHIIGGDCPAQTYHKEIAREYEEVKTLPLPFSNCTDILEDISKRGLPKSLQAIRDKLKIN